MQVSELAQALRDAVNRAPEGQIVVSIHMFAIRHARELQDVALRDVVDGSGIPSSYVTEINQGIRLAEYVVLK